MSALDVHPVSAVDDPQLRDFIALRDVELRTSLEAEHGLFIAEGEKVIKRALAAGHRARSFLLAARWLDDLRGVIEASGAPCYVLDDAEIERLTGFHVHRGALAAMHRDPLPSLDRLLATARRMVVCEDIVDHANVGSIFRNAAAFGIDAVVVSPRCADPLYRRAVKVSMGTVFAVPYTRLRDWYGGLESLRAAGFELLALTPAPDAAALSAVAAELGDRRAALLVGSEGHGLSGRWSALADRAVRIPMAPGVDSLNVAAATAVGCYELARAGAP